MPRKQLLILLPIVALSTLTVHFNYQSKLAMSATEVGQQQRGRETAQANYLQNGNENWLPRVIAAFIVGGHIIYIRNKRQ